MNLDNQNEEDHKSIMSSHQQLLWKIVSSLERIETTLIGNAANSNGAESYGFNYKKRATCRK